MYLPLGNAAGEYELEIVSQADKSVWHAAGRASIKDGLTSVPVAGDFRGVPEEGYRFRFRRLNESWGEKPVLVK